MEEVLETIGGFFTAERIATLVRVVVIIVVGLLLARFVGTVLGRVAAHRAGPHQQQLTQRLVRYVLVAVVVLMVLNEIGFDLGVLLGAAGLLTVALGFAAQASTSNIISGIFLVSERAFQVGDNITIGGTTGEVLSIDLLSVKLRTFDNLYVRIPNETLLKTEIRNLSRFPIRRLDIPITVTFGEPYERVKALLINVSANNDHCLDEPGPQIFFTGLGDFGYNVQYSVWCARERFGDVRASLHAEVVAALNDAGIAIPMPRQAIFAGDGELTVRIADAAPGSVPPMATPKG